MTIFKALIALAAMAFVATTAARAGEDCPSEVTINISSIGYSGAFAVELRRSDVEETATMDNAGTHTFHNVCPGTYFFAIGPQDSDEVSVTSYFDVTFDGRSYNNPNISIYYSSATDAGHQVGKARKSQL